MIDQVCVRISNEVVKEETNLLSQEKYKLVLHVHVHVHVINY